MRAALLPLLLFACTGDDADTSVDPPDSWTIAQAWNGEVDVARPVFPDVVVTSPRTADGLSFYVQARGGGPRSGMRVDMPGNLDGLPPALGSPINVTGSLSLIGGAPALAIGALDDVVVAGSVESPTLSAVTGTIDDLFGVYTVPTLTQTSAADPIGRADSSIDGLGFDGVFAVTAPGWMATGALSGVMSYPGRISARTEADQAGFSEGQPPLELSIAELLDGDYAEGTFVQLAGVVQATPWSSTKEWTVLQDGEGRAVWVSTEFWHLQADTAAGDVGTWRGDWRREGFDGARIRVWDEPTMSGTATVVLRGTMEDGSLTSGSYTDVDGPDFYGEWTTAEGVVLDNRFIDLADLPGALLAQGAVKIDGLDRTRLCVLDWN